MSDTRFPVRSYTKFSISGEEEKTRYMLEIFDNYLDWLEEVKKLQKTIAYAEQQYFQYSNMAQNFYDVEDDDDDSLEYDKTQDALWEGEKLMGEIRHKNMQKLNNFMEKLIFYIGIDDKYTELGYNTDTYYSQISVTNLQTRIEQRLNFYFSRLIGEQDSLLLDRINARTDDIQERTKLLVMRHRLRSAIKTAKKEDIADIEFICNVSNDTKQKYVDDNGEVNLEKFKSVMLQAKKHMWQETHASETTTEEVEETEEETVKKLVTPDEPEDEWIDKFVEQQERQTEIRNPILLGLEDLSKPIISTGLAPVTIKPTPKRQKIKEEDPSEPIIPKVPTPKKSEEYLTVSNPNEEYLSEPIIPKVPKPNPKRPNSEEDLSVQPHTIGSKKKSFIAALICLLIGLYFIIFPVGKNKKQNRYIAIFILTVSLLLIYLVHVKS